jgi:hypothetical protein
MGGEGSSVKRRGWVEGGRRPGEWEGRRERHGRAGIDSKEGGVDIRVSEGSRGREGREGRVGVSGRIDREERGGRVGVSGSNCREESEERERVMGT